MINLIVAWCTEGIVVMQSNIVSEDEVLDYFVSLSNWNRWGRDDELGTLNFLSNENTRRAASLVRDGCTVSCARTVMFEPGPDVNATPMHFMVESGEGWASDNKLTNVSNQGATDFFGMIFHGYTITHIDTPAHCFWKGEMYNGRPAHLVSTNLGATAESVELAKHGIVARGILVDVPKIRDVQWLDRGEGVMPSDIRAAESSCGFEIEEGDVLLIRTGQLHRRNVEGPVDLEQLGSTACQASCLPLFHERGISMLGSDTPNDVMPSGYMSVPSPIHQVGIVAMGMWILDNANLEELAIACEARNRWEFMLSIAPLRLHNTTGSPVNPLAIF